jgi:hypothetical protein
VELLKWCRMQWDRVLACVAMAVGLVQLVVGWLGVSGTGYVAKQVPYVVSAGLGAIVSLLIGGTLWLSADLRDEWRALDQLDDRDAAREEEMARLEDHLAAAAIAIDRLEARLTTVELAATTRALATEREARNGNGAAAPRARRSSAKAAR